MSKQVLVRSEVKVQEQPMGQVWVKNKHRVINKSRRRTRDIDKGRAKSKDKSMGMGCGRAKGRARVSGRARDKG